MDQVQNESPLAIIDDSTTQTHQVLSSTESQPITPKFVFPTEHLVAPERILEFRPVQKKQTVRPKPMPKYMQFCKKIVDERTTFQNISSFDRYKTGPRAIEIHRFNNTILSGDDLRIFTYYWRIEHFSLKLNSNISHISSPIFTISGLHMRVKATLNNLNRDYFHLQLESVAKDALSNQINVVLQPGDMFKEIETKVLFKHKIAILDQVSERKQDLQDN